MEELSVRTLAGTESPQGTTSAEAIPDARVVPTKWVSEAVLLEHLAPSAISPVHT